MDEAGTRRVTVEEAAQLLGIEKGSVKKRIQRGKLRSEKDATGTHYVYVDESGRWNPRGSAVPGRIPPR